jgi:hypothetical protein
VRGERAVRACHLWRFRDDDLPEEVLAARSRQRWQPADGSGLWPWPQWRAAYGHPLVTAGHRGHWPPVTSGSASRERARSALEDGANERDGSGRGSGRVVHCLTAEPHWHGHPSTRGAPAPLAQGRLLGRGSGFRLRAPHFALTGRLKLRRDESGRGGGVRGRGRERERDRGWARSKPQPQTPRPRPCTLRPRRGAPRPRSR